MSTPSSIRSRCWLAFGLLLLLLTSPRGLASALDPQVEYKLKAAYLYNFTKFVEWPAATYETETSPCIIVVVENDAIVTRALHEVLDGKSTGKGRPIEIRTVHVLSNMGVGHIVFISRSAQSDAASARTAIGNRPVLLVGESPGFAQSGRTINFLVAGDAIRLEINPHRAERVGLHLSGTLASIAKLVRDREDLHD